jgi:hypothetical protein
MLQRNKNSYIPASNYEDLYLFALGQIVSEETRGTVARRPEL